MKRSISACRQEEVRLDVGSAPTLATVGPRVELHQEGLRVEHGVVVRLDWRGAKNDSSRSYSQTVAYASVGLSSHSTLFPSNCARQRFGGAEDQ